MIGTRHFVIMMVAIVLENVLIDESNNNLIVTDFGIDYIKVENGNLEEHLDSLLQLN